VKNLVRKKKNLNEDIILNEYFIKFSKKTKIFENSKFFNFSNKIFFSFKKKIILLREIFFLFQIIFFFIFFLKFKEKNFLHNI
jgi:hypothetical protein